jgi:hypothetical protein
MFAVLEKTGAGEALVFYFPPIFPLVKLSTPHPVPSHVPAEQWERNTGRNE